MLFLFLISQLIFSLGSKTNIRKLSQVLTKEVSSQEGSLLFIFDGLDGFIDEIDPELLSVDYILDFFKKKQDEHAKRFDVVDKGLEGIWNKTPYSDLEHRANAKKKGAFNQVLLLEVKGKDCVAKKSQFSLSGKTENVSEKIKQRIEKEINKFVDKNSNEVVVGFLKQLSGVWTKKEQKFLYFYEQKFSREVIKYFYSGHLEFHMVAFMKLLSCMSQKKVQWSGDYHSKLEMATHYICFLNAIGLNKKAFKAEKKIRDLIEKAHLGFEVKREMLHRLGAGQLSEMVFSEDATLYAWKETILQQEKLKQDGQINKEFSTPYLGSILMKESYFSKEKVRVTLSSQYDMTLKEKQRVLYTQIGKNGAKWNQDSFTEILSIVKESFQTLKAMKQAGVVNLDSYTDNYGVSKKDILMDDYDRVQTGASPQKQGVNLTAIASFLADLTLGLDVNVDLRYAKRHIIDYFTTHPYQVTLEKEWRREGFCDFDFQKGDTSRHGKMSLYYRFPLFVDKLAKDIIDKKGLPIETRVEHFSEVTQKVWMMLLVQVARSMIEGDYDVEKLEKWAVFVEEVIKNPSLYEQIADQEVELLSVVKVSEGSKEVLKTVDPPELKEKGAQLSQLQQEGVKEEESTEGASLQFLFKEMSPPSGEVDSELYSVDYILDFFGKKQKEHVERFDKVDKKLQKKWSKTTYQDLEEKVDRKMRGLYNEVLFLEVQGQPSVIKRNVRSLGGVIEGQLPDKLKQKIEQQLLEMLKEHSKESINEFFVKLFQVWDCAERDKTKSYFEGIFSRDVLRYLYSGHFEFHVFIFFKSLSYLSPQQKQSILEEPKVRFYVSTYAITFLNAIGLGEKVFQQEKGLRYLIKNAQIDEEEKKACIMTLGSIHCSGRIFSEEVGLYAWKEATLQQEQLKQKGQITQSFTTEYQGSALLKVSKNDNHKVRVIVSNKYDYPLVGEANRVYKKIGKDEKKWKADDHLEILKSCKQMILTLKQMKQARVVNLDAHINNYGIKEGGLLMDDYDRVLTHAPLHKQAINLTGFVKFLSVFTIETHSVTYSESLKGRILQYLDMNEYIDDIQNKKSEEGFRDFVLQEATQAMSLYYQFPILIDRLSRDMLKGHQIPIKTRIGNFEEPIKKVWMMLLVQVARSMIEGDYDVEKLEKWANFVEEVIKDPSLYEQIADQEAELLSVVKVSEDSKEVLKTVDPPELKEKGAQLSHLQQENTKKEESSKDTSLQFLFKEIAPSVDEVDSQLMSVDYILGFFDKKQAEHAERFDEVDRKLQETWGQKTYEDIASQSDYDSRGVYNEVLFLEMQGERKVAKKGIKNEKVIQGHLSQEMKVKTARQLKSVLEGQSNESVKEFFDKLFQVWKGQQSDEVTSYYKKVLSDDVLEYLYAGHFEFHIFIFFKALSYLNVQQKQSLIEEPTLKFTILTYTVTLLNAIGLGNKVFQQEKQLRDLIQESQLNKHVKTSLLERVGPIYLSGNIFSEEVGLYAWKEATLKQEKLLKEGKIRQAFTTEYQGSVILRESELSETKVRVTFSNQYNYTLENEAGRVFRQIEGNEKEWEKEDFLEILPVCKQMVQTLKAMKQAEIVSLDAHMNNYGIREEGVLADDYDRILTYAPNQKQALNLMGLAKYLSNFTLEYNTNSYISVLSYWVNRYLENNEYRNTIQKRKKEEGYVDFVVEQSKEGVGFYYQFPLLVDRLSRDMVDQNEISIKTRIGNFEEPIKKVWMMLLVQVARAMIEGDYDVEKLEKWILFVEKIIKKPSLYEQIGGQEIELLSVVDLSNGFAQVAKTVDPPILRKEESVQPAEEITLFSEEGITGESLVIKAPSPFKVMEKYKERKRRHKNEFMKNNDFLERCFIYTTIEALNDKVDKTARGGLNEVVFLTIGEEKYVAKKSQFKEKQEKNLPKNLKIEIKESLKKVAHSESMNGWAYLDYLIEFWDEGSWSQEQLNEYSTVLKKHIPQEAGPYLDDNNLECHLLIFFEMFSLMKERDSGFSKIKESLQLKILSHYFALLNSLGFNDSLHDEEKLIERIKSSTQITQNQKYDYIALIQVKGIAATRFREIIANENWKEVTIKQREMIQNKEIDRPFAVAYEGSLVFHESKNSKNKLKYTFMKQFEKTLDEQSEEMFPKKTGQEGVEEEESVIVEQDKEIQVKWKEEEFLEILNIFDKTLDCLSSMKKAKVINADAMALNYGMNQEEVLTYDYDVVLNQVKDSKQSLNLIGLAMFIYSFVGDQNGTSWGYFKIKRIKTYWSQNKEQNKKIEEQIKRIFPIHKNESFMSTMQIACHHFILLVNQWSQDVLNGEGQEKLLWNMKGYPDPVKKVWVMLIVQMACCMLEGDYDVEKLRQWGSFVRKVIKEPHLYENIVSRQEEWLLVIDSQGQVKKSQYPPFDLLNQKKVHKIEKVVKGSFIKKAFRTKIKKKDRLLKRAA